MTKKEKYANLIIRSGLNIREGDLVLIRSTLETARFAQELMEASYKAGARDVHILYNDEVASRIRISNAGIDALTDIRPWQLDTQLDFATRGACFIRIAGGDPDIYLGLDSAKIAAYIKATDIAMKPYHDRVMANENRWCVVAVPSPAWAAKVFPDATAQEADEKLWAAIFEACHVNADDPVADWAAHTDGMRRHTDWLNAQAFAAVRFESANGTNLTLGLVDDAHWASGMELCKDGVLFSPNIPTEEIFTAPHKNKVDGVVKSTKPLCYNGVIIDDFSLTFKAGEVVDFRAGIGAEALAELMKVDAGSVRLGEVAIVPFSSPINRTGLIFRNTLFDENASCHLALGKGYPDSVNGGGDMDEQSLEAKGLNDSLCHEDFMVGDADTKITGIAKDGTETVFFDGGEWVI